MNQPPDISFLSRDVQELFTVLRDRSISYVLVGGVALLKYIEGRNTQDIDLLLSLQSLKEIPELTIIQEEFPALRASFKSVPVDILLTRDPLFKLVHDQFATTHPFQEITVRCATVEGLLLLKLYALPSLYRQSDTQRIALYETDILMLIDRHRPVLEPLFQILTPFVDEGALTELRKIVEDIQMRIQRTKSKKN